MLNLIINTKHKNPIKRALTIILIYCPKWHKESSLISKQNQVNLKNSAYLTQNGFKVYI